MGVLMMYEANTALEPFTISNKVSEQLVVGNPLTCLSQGLLHEQRTKKEIDSELKRCSEYLTDAQKKFEILEAASIAHANAIEEFKLELKRRA